MQTILIVDDSAMTRKILRRALEASDRPLRLIEAGDGVEALEVLDAHPTVDVLISDLNMPRMGGEELIERVNARPSRPPCIVVISSTISTVRKLRLVRLGVNHVMAKPFKPEQLQQRLESMIGAASRPELDSESEMVLDASMVDTLAHMVFRVSLPLEGRQEYPGPSVAATVRMSGAAQGEFTLLCDGAWAATVSRELTGEAAADEFVAELVNIVGGGIVASVESRTGQDVHLDTPTVRHLAESVEVDRAYELEDDCRIGVVWELTIPTPAGV